MSTVTRLLRDVGSFAGDHEDDPYWRPGAYFRAIKEQAIRGSFDPESLDELLSELARELHAAYQGDDLERALNSASNMLRGLEETAACVRLQKTGSAELGPEQHTIAEVIGRRGAHSGAAPVQGPAGLAGGLPFAQPGRLTSARLKVEQRRLGGVASEPAQTSQAPIEPPETRPACVAEPVTGASPSHMVALDGRALRKSVVPTWLALVALSWVSLLWGGLISMPFGVGGVVLGSAMGGIFAVPLWATVFGFFGMGRARASTLKALGFEPLGPEVFLAQSCERFARALNIQPPQLGTMEGFNAFAMGTDRNDATITLGRPLLDALTPEEAEAVLAHEIAHVVSGDMKRMMLMRTFQNATVWFMMAQGLKQCVRWVICWAAELYILAFSRKREYWADAIGAALTSKEAMIGALRKLDEGPPLTDAENVHARFMVRGRISGLFSTHPSGDERIAALEQETYVRQLPRVTL